MESLEKRVAKIKKSMVELKALSNTTGDSATAYREVYDLGEYPRDNYQHYYVWDFYFEPVANVENFTLMPSITECWGYYNDAYGSDFYASFNRVYGGQDISDPLHVMVVIHYLPSSGYTVNGNNTLVVTANSKFVLKSSTKSSKTFS